LLRHPYSLIKCKSNAFIGKIEKGFTMYEMFEEFKGSMFNCLRRSKVQVLKSLKCLKGFGIWNLDLGIWNLEFGSWYFFIPS
jgi:hypothetical protein